MSANALARPSCLHPAHADAERTTVLIHADVLCLEQPVCHVWLSPSCCGNSRRGPRRLLVSWIANTQRWSHMHLKPTSSWPIDGGVDRPDHEERGEW